MNRACELGPSRFSWWKDWRGKSVAIIASGPSIKETELGHLRGIPVLAIKENIELYPDAEVVYGCDAAWWMFRDGLSRFKGVKLCYDDRPRQHYKDIHEIRIDREKDKILLDEPGLIGNGRNSGFQAINIAVQFGAKKILLVGFDMNDRNPDHWYGRNTWHGANNPEGYRMPIWRGHIEDAYADLKKIGVELFNASEQSAIRFIPKIKIEEFSEWASETKLLRQA
jgi:hypothetical protein